MLPIENDRHAILVDMLEQHRLQLSELERCCKDIAHAIGVDHRNRQVHDPPACYGADEDVRDRGAAGIDDRARVRAVRGRRQRAIRRGGEIEELLAGGIEQNDVLPVGAQGEEILSERAELVDCAGPQDGRGAEQLEAPDAAFQLALHHGSERVHGAFVLRANLIALADPQLQQQHRREGRHRHQPREQQADEVRADAPRTARSGHAAV